MILTNPWENESRIYVGPRKNSSCSQNDPILVKFYLLSSWGSRTSHNHHFHQNLNVPFNSLVEASLFSADAFSPPGNHSAPRLSTYTPGYAPSAYGAHWTFHISRIAELLLPRRCAQAFSVPLLQFQPKLASKPDRFWHKTFAPTARHTLLHDQSWPQPSLCGYSRTSRAVVQPECSPVIWPLHTIPVLIENRTL